MKKVTMCCTTCPNSCEMTVTIGDDNTIADCTGNTCPRGLTFAEGEWKDPVRLLTSTMIRITDAGQILVPVKSATPIPRRLMRDAMEAIRKTPLTHPVALGDVLIPNVAGSGVAIVAARTVN